MFILLYFENYKCWWDLEPNITEVNTDPEKLFSDSCQQIVINFFVVVQAHFWACSPLALCASSAVPGTLCSTNPSSLLLCWLQKAVRASLQSPVKLPLLYPDLQTRNCFFLSCSEEAFATSNDVISPPGLFNSTMTRNRLRLGNRVLPWQLSKCFWVKLISSSNMILIQVQSECLGKLHISA